MIVSRCDLAPQDFVGALKVHLASDLEKILERGSCRSLNSLKSAGI